MIIIRKKRLLLIGSLLCASLTIFSLKSAFTKPKVVATVNLPVSNKVIVIDAGHRSSRRTELKVVMGQQKQRQT